jgi:hypothetical protein
MYGLPADFDPAPFIGRRLDRICFAQSIIFFYFQKERSKEGFLDGVASDEITVALESSFLLQVTPEDPGFKQTSPVASADVMRLIGKNVTAAKGKRDGTLALTFEDGATLSFLDDSPRYESYQIWGEGIATLV